MSTRSVQLQLGIAACFIALFLIFIGIPQAVSSPSNVKNIVLAPTFWPYLLSGITGLTGLGLIGAAWRDKSGSENLIEERPNAEVLNAEMLNADLLIEDVSVEDVTIEDSPNPDLRNEVTPADAVSTEAEEAITPPGVQGWLRLAALAVIMIITMYALPRLGMVWTTMLVFITTATLFRTRHPLIALLCAVLIPLLLYLFFAHVAGVGIPQGNYIRLP